MCPALNPLCAGRGRGVRMCSYVCDGCGRGCGRGYTTRTLSNTCFVLFLNDRSSVFGWCIRHLRSTPTATLITKVPDPLPQLCHAFEEQFNNNVGLAGHL